jgi:hypothetical protein
MYQSVTLTYPDKRSRTFYMRANERYSFPFLEYASSDVELVAPFATYHLVHRLGNPGFTTARVIFWETATEEQVAEALRWHALFYEPEASDDYVVDM